MTEANARNNRGECGDIVIFKVGTSVTQKPVPETVLEVYGNIVRSKG